VFSSKCSPFVRVLFVIVFCLLVVPALMGAAPPRQGTIPDPDSFLVYGIPWVLVGVVLIGLLKRYLSLSEEGGVLISAAWATAGYLVLQNLPAIESVAPWLPTYLPQVLAAVLIFGAQLGLIPGTTARKVVAVFKR
jgi:hypothetical protein